MFKKNNNNNNKDHPSYYNFEFPPVGQRSYRCCPITMQPRGSQLHVRGQGISYKKNLNITYSLVVFAILEFRTHTSIFQP